MTEPVVQLLIVTAEGFGKVRPAIAGFAQDLPENLHITVASGLAGDPGELAVPGAETRHFPGESVFHLRSRLPSLAADCDWLVILEDHNHVTRQWFAALQMVLRNVPDDVRVVIGGTSNLTSRDDWSWANYIHTLGFHWAPAISEPVEPITFNIVLRRKTLPDEDFTLGAYEAGFVHGLMANAVASSDFPIDHVQFRKAPGVFKYHWHNGRVTGAFMRRHYRGGLRHVYAHVRDVVGPRLRRLDRVIDEHPQSGLLPRGTKRRLRMLSLCHAAGALFGGVAGEGQAPWGLE